MTQARLRSDTVKVDQGGEALSKALNDWLQEFGGVMFKNCANCQHMAMEGAPICGLYNTTPPAKVIVAGCPSHVDNQEIPF